MAWLLKLCIVSVAFAGLHANTDDLSFKDEIVRDEEWLDPTNMFISKSSFDADSATEPRIVAVAGDDVVVRPLSTRCVLFLVNLFFYTRIYHRDCHVELVRE